MDNKIYETIRDRITLLNYSPGDVINEKSICAEFGVSRTPVREALARLEWEKLIKIIPRAGAIVAPIDFKQIRDVYQIRAYVEGLIGRLSAERITNHQIEEIKAIRKQGLKLKKRGTPEELIKLDIKFREVFNRSANNAILKEISDFLYNITVRVWRLVIQMADWESEVNLVIDEIDKTLLVLEKRNAKELEKTRHDTVYGYMEIIKSKL